MTFSTCSRQATVEALALAKAAKAQARAEGKVISLSLLTIKCRTSERPAPAREETAIQKLTEAIAALVGLTLWAYFLWWML